MIVEKSGDKVEEPGDSACANYPKNAYLNLYEILLLNANYDTLDSPYDVKRGYAKNELDELGESVNCLDKISHFYSP